MLDQLYQVKKKDLARFAQTMELAFQSDPLIAYLLGDKDSPQNRRAVFKMQIKSVFKQANFYATSPDLTAILAISLDLAPNPSDWTYLCSGAIPLLFRLGEKQLRQMEEYEKFALAKRKELGQNAIYLFVLAILPKFQGLGLSRQLIDPLFALARKLDRPIYLETHNQANLAYYQNMGFDLLSKEKIPASNIYHYSFLSPKNI